MCIIQVSTKYVKIKEMKDTVSCKNKRKHTRVRKGYRILTITPRKGKQ